MDQYITTHLKVNRKFKNQSERKKFLKEKGVKFVKHPKSGVEMVAVECKTQLLQGKRVSASHVKEYDYDAESKAAAKEAHEKSAAEIDLSDKVNTKATGGYALDETREQVLSLYRRGMSGICFVQSQSHGS